MEAQRLVAVRTQYGGPDTGVCQNDSRHVSPARG
jgi:hypothetical protein